MKNKIKNTEMEYIAKANCGVDSSFLTDGFRRVIAILFFFSFLVFFKRPGSLFYVKVCFLSTVDAALKSLRIFRNVQKKFITSAGSVYI